MYKDYECFYCFANTFGKLIENNNLKKNQKTEFTQFFSTLSSDKKEYSSPEMAAELHRKLKDLSNIQDIYKNEKELSNQKALEISEKWKNKIKLSENPFELVLKLSIAGNIMDYGCNNEFDIEKNIDYVLKSEFTINHSHLLKEQISKAKQILYLGDNAGEIVFDKMFIEQINHKNLYYAVRGFPVINDVTITDAQQIGLDKISKLISNGDDSPSTILDRCSKEFLEIWKNSDLIISKGQGNLEGLMENTEKNIFFLLMVKCNVIAEHLKVKKNDFVVKCNLINH